MDSGMVITACAFAAIFAVVWCVTRCNHKWENKERLERTRYGATDTIIYVAQCERCGKLRNWRVSCGGP